jgi:cobalt/nickel transport system ATP-binding protein
MNVIQVDNLHYTYPGCDSEALRGASLTLPAGKKVAVVGRNGSGKSTLFLHCNGILRPGEGVVYFSNQPLTYDCPTLHKVRRRVGVVFQNPDDQLFSASVYQDISFGPLNLGMSKEEAKKQVEKAAEVCDITHLLDRPTHALSGGEKAKVALAGVLAMDPVVLIADEPTASLDPWMSRQVFAIFERLVKQGKTVVLATHNIDVVKRWADLVVVIEQGVVLAVDTPENIFADEELMALTQLNEPLF